MKRARYDSGGADREDGSSRCSIPVSERRNISVECSDGIDAEAILVAAVRMCHDPHYPSCLKLIPL